MTVKRWQSGYLARRLWLVPLTLWLVSLLAFALQESAPGDPVTSYLQQDLLDPSLPLLDYRVQAAAYERAAAELGARLPAFYVTIRTLAVPDTLHRILPLRRRKAFRQWCQRSGHPGLVQAWYNHLDQWAMEIRLRDPQHRNQDFQPARRIAVELPLVSDPQQVRKILSQLPDSLLGAAPATWEERLPTQQVWSWRNWIPVVSWHGAANRYHRWLTSFFTASPARSWQDGQPVFRKIWLAARWTLLMNGIALVLAFGISIPVGVWLAGHAGRRRDRWTTFLLYAAYSVPGFWLGTLLLIFLTTPTYGMDWFPSLGLGSPDPGAPWWEVLRIRLSHLILPVFCLTYGAVAYLTRQVRNAMLQELKEPYILQAWAWGLTRRQVLWQQAFRNARFPLITILGTVLPGLLAGSVAIEIIFNIPGMGRLTYTSILAQDWPVVYRILLLAAGLTILGTLLADLLYSRTDPRVRLDAQQHR